MNGSDYRIKPKIKPINSNDKALIAPDHVARVATRHRSVDWRHAAGVPD